ncbi:MAG: zinc ribbon domain-containing protein [bacterium]|nr:zinc ribbon domain-containing protein [bacterium]
MKSCPACKYQNEDDAKFCKGCGIPLKSAPVTVAAEETEKQPISAKTVFQKVDKEIDGNNIEIKTIRCPNCGNDTLPDFETCTQCGRPLIPIAVQSYMQSQKQEASEKFNLEKKRINGNEEIKNQPQPPAEPFKEESPDESWEVVYCPVCGRRTRTSFGYCLNCRVSLSPQSQLATGSDSASITSRPVELQPTEARGLPPADIAGEKPKPAIHKNRLRAIIPIIIVIFIVSIIFLGILLFVYRSHRSERIALEEELGSVAETGITAEISAVVAVFDTVRDATLAKDTELLMSCYSAQFPDYQQKLKDTEETIRTYDIVSLTYVIDSSAIKITPDTAELPIQWQIKLRKYDDGSTISATDSNYVVLTKENNRWKIVQVFQR